MQGRCPKCNRAYEISDEFVAMGGRAKCPHCLQDLIFKKEAAAKNKEDRFWETTRPDPNRQPAEKNIPAPGPQELEARCLVCNRRYRVKKSFLESGAEARCLHCDARLSFPELVESTQVAPEPAAAAARFGKQVAAEMKPAVEVEPPLADEAAPEEDTSLAAESPAQEQTADYAKQETARINLPELDEFLAGKDTPEAETQEHALSDLAFDDALGQDTKKFTRDELGLMDENGQEEIIVDGQLVAAAAGELEEADEEPSADDEDIAGAMDFPQEEEVEDRFDLEGERELAPEQEPAWEEEMIQPQQQRLEQKPEAEQESELEAESGAAREMANRPQPGVRVEFADETVEAEPDEEIIGRPLAVQQPYSSESAPPTGEADWSGQEVEEPYSDGDTDKSGLVAGGQPIAAEKQGAERGGVFSDLAPSDDWAKAAAEWAQSGFDPDKMPSFVAQKDGPARAPSSIELPQEMALLSGKLEAIHEEALEVSDSDILEPDAPEPPAAESRPSLVKAAPQPVESRHAQQVALPKAPQERTASWTARFSSPVFLVLVGVVIIAVFASIWWLLSREDVEKYAFPNPPPSVKSIEAPAPSGYKTRWEAVEHYGLGNRYAHQGRFEDAIIEYKQASRIDPGFPLPHRALGAVYAALGNRALSLLSYETYIGLDPAAPDAESIRKNIVGRH